MDLIAPALQAAAQEDGRPRGWRRVSGWHRGRVTLSGERSRDPLGPRDRGHSGIGAAMSRSPYSQPRAVWNREPAVRTAGEP